MFLLQIQFFLYLEVFTISGARNKLESEGKDGSTAEAAQDEAKVSPEVINGLISELEELAVMLRD